MEGKIKILKYQNKKVEMMHNSYEDHYMKQAYGGGLPVFIASQKGREIGGTFNGLARMIIPVLKRTWKTVLKEVLRSGMDVLGDIVSGQNVKSSLKKELRNIVLGQWINP